jgi:hypothetical protein
MGGSEMDEKRGASIEQVAGQAFTIEGPTLATFIIVPPPLRRYTCKRGHTFTERDGCEWLLVWHSGTKLETGHLCPHCVIGDLNEKYGPVAPGELVPEPEIK